MAMSQKLKAAFDREMELARTRYEEEDFSKCFYHLERAHILGQRYYIPHVINHSWMLKVGLRQKNIREVIGQLLRIIGSVGSLIGWVPIGNTGGANVSPVKSMPIPNDLLKYFDE